MDWIGLSKDRDQMRDLLNKVMIRQVTQNGTEFLSSCTTGSFSRIFQPHGDVRFNIAVHRCHAVKVA
jgi:hypothetical protein